MRKPYYTFQKTYGCWNVHSPFIKCLHYLDWWCNWIKSQQLRMSFPKYHIYNEKTACNNIKTIRQQHTPSLEKWLHTLPRLVSLIVSGWATVGQTLLPIDRHDPRDCRVLKPLSNLAFSNVTESCGWAKIRLNERLMLYGSQQGFSDINILTVGLSLVSSLALSLVPALPRAQWETPHALVGWTL